VPAKRPATRSRTGQRRPTARSAGASLATYRRKRRFDVTPEPRGRKARKTGNLYVIQKHAATRLHYDLRLELDGVMKSWAVTRGPSLVPGEKRHTPASTAAPLLKKSPPVQNGRATPAPIMSINPPLGSFQD